MLAFIKVLVLKSLVGQTVFWDEAHLNESR